MQYLLPIFILIFSFSACTDDTKQHEKQINAIKEAANEEKNQLLKALQVKDNALKKVQLETQKLQEELLKQKQSLLALEQKMLSKQTTVHKDDKLSKVGITVQDDKITLDTSKTKDFFENFAQELSSKLQKVSQELQQDLHSGNDTGVNISETNINIDLNKTKDFLQEWGNKMQGFIKEFDDIARDLNIETKNTDYIK
ncbi:MAG: hypothetical protein L3J43_10960 [Sulfurovum sp.]|nr:hypothetical protein [Sulfurovum sp.]